MYKVRSSHIRKSTLTLNDLCGTMTMSKLLGQRPDGPDEVHHGGAGAVLAELLPTSITVPADFVIDLDDVWVGGFCEKSTKRLLKKEFVVEKDFVCLAQVTNKGRGVTQQGVDADTCEPSSDSVCLPRPAKRPIQCESTT
jgi:hypothetical protein